MASSMPTQIDEDLRKAVHYLSWSCLIGGPLILAMPPRKLNLTTLGLLIATFAGANEVSREQTGISMIDRMGQRLAKSTASLPPKALEIQQRRITEERERNQRSIQRIVGDDGLLQQSTKQEILSEQGKKSSSFWNKVWMGGEGENWKEERLRKEREALESGKGYFDLIMDQIYDVWNNEGSKVKTNKTELDVNKDFKSEEPHDDFGDARKSN